MPFGHWKDFDDCLKDIKRRNPKYSDEVVHKVCGKLKHELEKAEEGIHEKVSQALKEYVSSKPSPTKEDLKEVGPIHKAWEFDPSEILSSPRKVKGTFHVPKVDKDNEIITDTAMQKAIPDFIHLPILHDFHRERVLGLITKVYEEAGAYHFEALFKATHDVDDAWAKVQKGEYDHVSIYGSRLNGSPSCGLDPNQRSTPCISNAIRLDSISACDDNARNDHTSLTMAKSKVGETLILNNIEESIIKALNTNSNIIKAESTSSSLMHGTYDGVRRRFMNKCGCEEEKALRLPPENVHRFRQGQKKLREHPTTKRWEREDVEAGMTNLHKGDIDGWIEQTKKQGWDPHEVAEHIVDEKQRNAVRERLKKGCDCLKKTRVREVSEDDPVEEEVEKGLFHEGGNRVPGKDYSTRSGRRTGDTMQTAKQEFAMDTERRRGERSAGEGLKNMTKADEEDEVEKGDWVHSHGTKEGLQATHHGSGVKPRTKQKPGDTGFEVRQNKRVEKADDMDVEKADGVYKALLKAINSIFGKSDIEKGEDKSKIGYNKNDEKIEDKKFETEEAEEEEESTGEEKKATPSKYPHSTKTTTVEAHKHGEGRVSNHRLERVAKKEGLMKSDDEAEEEAEEDEVEDVKEDKDTEKEEKKARFGTRTQRSLGENKQAGENSAKQNDRHWHKYHGKDPHFRKADTMDETKTEEIVKAELTNEMTDEQFVTEIVKANMKTLHTEEIVKAALEKQSSEIMKALDEKLAVIKTLEERLKKVEENPIQKAAVVISEHNTSRRHNMDAVARIAGDV